MFRSGGTFIILRTEHTRTCLRAVTQMGSTVTGLTELPPPSHQNVSVDAMLNQDST